MSYIKDDKVFLARNTLLVALGDNSHKYFSCMKMWFRQKWTKEQFDREARKLFTPEQIHLHNQFLLAIINKLDGLVPIQERVEENVVQKSAKKRKTEFRSSDRVTFEPAEIYEYLPEECYKTIIPPTIAGNSPPPMPSQRYAAQELFLPDTGLILGRMMVGAWEIGLHTVDDAVADYVVNGVQTLLKNILTAVILRKKSCRYTSEGAYFYDVGADVKNPFLRNSIIPSITDEQPNKEVLQLQNQKKNEDIFFTTACEDLNASKSTRIRLLDVYEALKDRNVIPAFSVHAVNLERISHLMH